MAKKIWLLFIIILFSFSSFYGQSKNIHFSFEPQISLSYEKHGEYLFYENEEPISYLDWRGFPLIRTGIEAGFSIKNFTTEVELFSGVPVCCGTMYDSDWNSNGVKIIYSENNINLLSDFNSAIKLLYDFKFGRFEILPSLQLQYEAKSFKAHDGYGWYGLSDYSKSGVDVSWDDDNATYYSHIGGYSSYVIQNFLTFIGCQGKFAVSPSFSLGLGTYISPYSYTYTKDTHYKKSGKISKYVYAEQSSIFYRFKGEVFINVKMFNGLYFNTNISTVLGGKSFGDYRFYRINPFNDEYYLADTGKSASDLISGTIKVGIRKIF